MDEQEVKLKDSSDVPPSNHTIPMPDGVKAPKTEDVEEKKFRLRTILSDTDIETLRKVSTPVAFILGDNSGKAYLTKDSQDLIQALKDYVLTNKGLGMAAIQFGVTQRVFVMRKPFNTDNLLVVINPEILRGNKLTVKAEGCFSIPDMPLGVGGARVKRFSRIFVNYTDEYGVDYKEEMMMGMDARIFQHEFDHLNGILLLDEPKFQGWERSF